MSEMEYVLGSSDGERERLIRQAGTFAADASWLLDQVEVGPGWRAADIGCGPLGIIDLLSGRVGPTGQPGTVTIYWLLCQAWAQKPPVD